MVLSKLGFTHSDETKKRLSELNPYKNIGFFTGRKHTEESKAKIGEKSKGRIKSKEELEKLSLAHMNKKLSDSTKNKISEFNKTKVINGEHKFLKISSVDINGNCVFVSSDIFYNEKCKDVEERLYVGITSDIFLKTIWAILFSLSNKPTVYGLNSEFIINPIPRSFVINDYFHSTNISG